MSSDSDRGADRPLSWPLLLGMGFGISVLSTLCGIGGGVFAVPILHYLFGVPLKRAVATVLCLVWCVALSSTASEALHADSALNLHVVAALVAGVLVGTRLGYDLARRMPVQRLKLVFCLIFVVMGLQLALSGGASPAAVDPGEFELALSQVWIVVAIGLVAGILVPMLGIGGGLVMVPVLVLVLPGMGFLAARAASLATAVFSSSRSLLLYRGSGLVDWRVGRWFGTGAALGAILGVRMVHLEGVARVGRSALGGILLFAALRFGLDCWRARKDQA